jgi:SH3-like domain-containing protein
MSVQVRKADLRGTPSFLGKIVTSLPYGEKVAIEQQDGAWMKVAAAGQIGWVHSSALTARQVTLQAGGANRTGASSGEMALAGKGFNADIEAQFKANHKDIDFSPVDRMEKIVIPASGLLKFAADGGLVTKGDLP